MRITVWGSRGSLPAPGPDTMRYGGNTSCVEVRSGAAALILDAGTGLRLAGAALGKDVRHVDLFLTHLHMDHIQGLGFFPPLFNPQAEVRIWGPASTTMTLAARLSRYLSPPLFPIGLGDATCRLRLHELTNGTVTVGPFRISSQLVCHPGPTVGFRIEADGAIMTYLPDHEPAFGVRDFPLSPEWTSGYALADGADVLIHDTQYTEAEYDARAGWGHSTLRQAFKFGALARIKRLVTFHHDPAHDDQTLDDLVAEAVAEHRPPFEVIPGAELLTIDVGRRERSFAAR